MSTTNSGGSYLDVLEKDDRFTLWAARLKKVIRSNEELFVFGALALKQVVLDVKNEELVREHIEKMAPVDQALFLLFLQKILEFKTKSTSPEKRAEQVFAAFLGSAMK